MASRDNKPAASTAYSKTVATSSPSSSASHATYPTTPDLRGSHSRKRRLFDPSSHDDQDEPTLPLVAVDPSNSIPKRAPWTPRRPKRPRRPTSSTEKRGGEQKRGAMRSRTPANGGDSPKKLIAKRTAKIGSTNDDGEIEENLPPTPRKKTAIKAPVKNTAPMISQNAALAAPEPATDMMAMKQTGKAAVSASDGVTDTSLLATPKKGAAVRKTGKSVVPNLQEPAEEPLRATTTVARAKPTRGGKMATKKNGKATPPATTEIAREDPPTAAKEVIAPGNTGKARAPVLAKVTKEAPSVPPMRASVLRETTAKQTTEITVAPPTKETNEAAPIQAGQSTTTPYEEAVHTAALPDLEVDITFAPTNRSRHRNSPTYAQKKATAIPMRRLTFATAIPSKNGLTIEKGDKRAPSQVSQKAAPKATTARERIVPKTASNDAPANTTVVECSILDPEDIVAVAPSIPDVIITAPAFVHPKRVKRGKENPMSPGKRAAISRKSWLRFKRSTAASEIQEETAVPANMETDTKDSRKVHKINVIARKKKLVVGEVVKNIDRQKGILCPQEIDIEVTPRTGGKGKTVVRVPQHLVEKNPQTGMLQRRYQSHLQYSQLHRKRKALSTPSIYSDADHHEELSDPHDEELLDFNGDSDSGVLRIERLPDGASGISHVGDQTGIPYDGKRKASDITPPPGKRLRLATHDSDDSCGYLEDYGDIYSKDSAAMIGSRCKASEDFSPLAKRLSIDPDYPSEHTGNQSGDCSVGDSGGEHCALTWGNVHPANVVAGAHHHEVGRIRYRKVEDESLEGFEARNEKWDDHVNRFSSDNNSTGELEDTGDESSTGEAKLSFPMHPRVGGKTCPPGGYEVIEHINDQGGDEEQSDSTGDGGYDDKGDSSLLQWDLPMNLLQFPSLPLRVDCMPRPSPGNCARSPTPKCEPSNDSHGGEGSSAMLPLLTTGDLPWPVDEGYIMASPIPPPEPCEEDEGENKQLSNEVSLLEESELSRSSSPAHVQYGGKTVANISRRTLSATQSPPRHKQYGGKTLKRIHRPTDLATSTQSTTMLYPPLSLVHQLNGKTKSQIVSDNLGGRVHPSIRIWMVFCDSDVEVPSDSETSDWNECQHYQYERMGPKDLARVSKMLVEKNKLRIAMMEAVKKKLEEDRAEHARLVKNAGQARYRAKLRAKRHGLRYPPPRIHDERDPEDLLAGSEENGEQVEEEQEGYQGDFSSASSSDEEEEEEKIPAMPPRSPCQQEYPDVHSLWVPPKYPSQRVYMASSPQLSSSDIESSDVTVSGKESPTMRGHRNGQKTLAGWR